MSKIKVGTETRRLGKRKAEILHQVLRREPVVAHAAWRSDLLLGSRQRIVNKMMQTLKGHLPLSGLEGPVEVELTKIASIFEERIYAAATSQLDYLKKISLKMLVVETKSQKPMANSSHSNAADSSQIIPGAAVRQVEIPGQVMSGKAVMATDLEVGDWRTQLQPDSRERIVNKIFETLKRHLPFAGPEGLQEHRKLAVRFEEKIFAAAMSQSDYIRKISLKMLAMETKSQKPIANSLQSNAVSSSQIISCSAVGPLTSVVDSDNWHLTHRWVGIPDQAVSGKAVMATDMEGGDWRTLLQPDSRERVVNKIMETLKGLLPYSGPEGQRESRKIAVRFEEKIFAAATSQSDYLERISSKMLTMDITSQNPMRDPLESNAAISDQIPEGGCGNSIQLPRNPA